MKKIVLFFVFVNFGLNAQCISGDCENGNGTYVFEDNSRAEGNWKNGKLNGKCKIFYTSGNYYEGEMINDLKSGYGLYKTKDSEVRGVFNNDKLNGKGRINFTNNTIYEGIFKDGILNGLGKITIPDGSYYEGLFTNNNLNGKGIYVFNNGDKYEGNFKNSERHGDGIIYFLKGGTLKGTWLNDNYISGPSDDNTNVVKLEEINKSVFKINVEINNVLKIDMILDTGAADILLTKEIVLTLIKTKTIDENDILEGGSYTDANGNVNFKVRFNLKEIKIGKYIAKNVVCCVNENLETHNLLGIGALKKMGRKMQIDFEKNELLFY
jgi:hypothetical protein